MMSYEQAHMISYFWHAYYDNKDDRFIFKEKDLSPEEFFEVWIDKDRIHEFNDDPNRSKIK